MISFSFRHKVLGKVPKNEGGCKTVASYSVTWELCWQSKSGKLEVG